MRPRATNSIGDESVGDVLDSTRLGNGSAEHRILLEELLKQVWVATAALKVVKRCHGNGTTPFFVVLWNVAEELCNDKRLRALKDRRID